MVMKSRNFWKVAGAVWVLAMIEGAVWGRLLCAQARPKDTNLRFFPGEVIVKFTEEAFQSISFRKEEGGIIGTGISSIDYLNRKYQVEAAEAFVVDGDQGYRAAEDPYGLSRIYVLRMPQKADVESAARAFAKDHHCEFAEPSGCEVINDQVCRDGGFIAESPEVHDSPANCTSSARDRTPGEDCADGSPEVGAPIRPSDRFYRAGFPNRQWGLERINWSWPLVRAVSTGNMLTPAIIAIVDTGIDYTHPDLRGKVLVDKGYDFVDMDSDPMDTNGHGTAIAGIAAAVTNNSTGIAGTAPDALLLPVRVLDGTTSVTEPVQLLVGMLRIARGIRYAADHGAQVINLSLSWTDPARTIASALNYAYRVKGCILVAASGNENRKTISIPAAYPACIAVGATDRSDTRVDYDSGSGSNYGLGLEVVAPGDYMLTLNTVRHGLYTPAVTLSSLRDMAMVPNWGTSYATPFVSGLASLLCTQHPFAGNEAIRNHIRSTCDDLGNPIEYGYGIINVSKALLTPL